MKIFYSVTILFIAVFSFSVSKISAQSKEGEKIFKQTCAACHTIGKGRLVGPDLENVDQRKSESWLIKFIRSSEAVIKSGDKYADSLFQAYNQVPMPDRNDLTDNQIKEVIAFIKDKSPSIRSVSITDTVVNNGTSVIPQTEGDIIKGQELFVGNIRFANHGPTCNSCHNVNKDGMLTGGILAKDLTQSASRITADGIKGVLTGLPFPQMKEAYGKKILTEAEINDLTAFLNHVDEIAATQKQSSNEDNIMLVGGLAGIIGLLILYSLFWFKRRKKEVNYSIYERQTKSY